MVLRKGIDMSCFDEVAIPCPICGTEHMMQSSGGACCGEKFDFETAPIEVMAGIDARRPIMCKKCKSIFKVELSFSASIRLIDEGRFANADEN